MWAVDVSCLGAAAGLTLMDSMRYNKVQKSFRIVEMSVGFLWSDEMGKKQKTESAKTVVAGM